MNDTVPLLIVHTSADVLSIVSATGKPDVAVAVAAYDGPPATGPPPPDAGAEGSAGVVGVAAAAPGEGGPTRDEVGPLLG